MQDLLTPAEGPAGQHWCGQERAVYPLLGAARVIITVSLGATTACPLTVQAIPAFFTAAGVKSLNYPLPMSSLALVL
jgi:hypothetical protein